jgi:hypothetical protein
MGKGRGKEGWRERGKERKEKPRGWQVGNSVLRTEFAAKPRGESE